VLGLAALCAALQHGHEIKFVVKDEGSVSYKVWGNVFRTYAGGKRAPAIRNADVNGVYQLSFKKKADGFEIAGSWDALKLSSHGRPLPESDRMRATFGKWTGPAPAGPFEFLVNGQAGEPTLYSALCWPLIWSPFPPGYALRIGDEAKRDFMLPTHPFLEDDPVPPVKIPVRLVFEGPETEGKERYFRFRFETDSHEEVDANHPEKKGLKLKVDAMIRGSLQIRREDGRIESIAMFAKLVFVLAQPGSEFPFSRADGSISANWRRIADEKRK
jgi:hypothetical protein